MTRLSIEAGSVPGDIFAGLEAIAEEGITSVEQHRPDLTGVAGSARSVRQHAEGPGLIIDALRSFRRLAARMRIDRAREHA